MESRVLEQRLARAWPAWTAVAISSQLADAGFGERALATAVQCGLVVRLRRGAYVRTATWQQLKPWDREKIRLQAHLATAPGDPVYSYFSAARLHSLFVWNCGPLVHVTVPSASSGNGGPKDVAAHHEQLAGNETTSLTLHDGHVVTVTTLERTVFDCARTGGYAQAVIVGDHALRCGARLEVIWAMVNAAPGRRGVRRARRVLRSLDGRSESPGESRTRLIIAEMDIDQPVPQWELHAGNRLYRPDFVWEKQKMIVEFDGDIKYFNYQRTADVILEERKRERRLQELGWRFVRLEWADLANPREVKRRILAAYRAPSWPAAA
ncbi:hypothetical protein AAGW05_00805 [Arthrobacter sp. LAPM80]|uniref:hypothetical protein n=1 Tax=Arthrobacter sp. LAPM80 TaxID=3141788 RepID=UPI00398B7D30